MSTFNVHYDDKITNSPVTTAMFHIRHTDAGTSFLSLLTSLIVLDNFRKPSVYVAIVSLKCFFRHSNFLAFMSPIQGVYIQVQDLPPPPPPSPTEILFSLPRFIKMLLLTHCLMFAPLAFYFAL